MLLKILKTIASDVRQAAIPAILLLILGGTTGILLLSGKALILSKQIASTPTPLWATTLLVLLCCSYIYLKVRKIYRNNHQPRSLPRKTMLIEAGRFKWKTDIYETGEFKIHSIPYCITHETRLVEYQRDYACPVAPPDC